MFFACLLSLLLLGTAHDPAVHAFRGSISTCLIVLEECLCACMVALLCLFVSVCVRSNPVELCVSCLSLSLFFSIVCLHAACCTLRRAGFSQFIGDRNTLRGVCGCCYVRAMCCVRVSVVDVCVLHGLQPWSSQGYFLLV